MVVSRKGRSRVKQGEENLWDVSYDQRESFDRESWFGILASMNEGMPDYDYNMESSTSVTRTYAPIGTFARHVTVPKNET